MGEDVVGAGEELDQHDAADEATDVSPEGDAAAARVTLVGCKRMTFLR